MVEAATEVNAVQLTDAQRDELAEQLVSRFTAWSAAAGVIPVPVVDVIAIGGVQLQMLRRLAEIYNVPFSENRGKSVLASLIGSVIATTAATTVGVGVWSALKFVPVIGTTVAALTMPAMSAGATYVVGKVFIKHFASGGTLLDFNPGDYREFIKSHSPKSPVGAEAAPAQAEPVSSKGPASSKGPPSTSA
jgi:uncharacterized protein (DUF697 family)